jgi:DNA-binding NtrC family response regulator
MSTSGTQSHWLDLMKVLVAELLAASSFEVAATCTLRPLLDLARAAIEASPYAQRGRILRGLVHLRPDDGYRGLVVLEAGRDELSALPGDETRLPSTTLWRWVAERHSAVALDVMLGRVEPDRPGLDADRDQHQSWIWNSDKSQQRLLDREATHIYVLPLRGPRSTILGMVSIEAECRAAQGQPFIWADCREEFQLITDLAAPYLRHLPLRLASVDPTDDRLPVVGEYMAGIIPMLRVFAQQEETILLGGPTGSGKSRLARWCHEHSPRHQGAFETLDLSTVPEELQMAQLFGWKKGAFTNAIRDNPGSIGHAAGGTLFIDEIDKLSLRAQAGLLHVLEDRIYRPLGDHGAERRANVRFIVGTNANLQAAVRDGRFREDLYYRINVLPVRLPPLRERSDEIPQWARFMLQRRHREHVPEGVSDIDIEGERLLLVQPWRGNLRQLDNIIRRAYTLAVMEHSSPPQELRLHREHLARALDHESEESRPLIEALHRAATSFVIEAERRALQGDPLDLDLVDAFKGLVLAAAAERRGSWEEAFRLLSRDALVKNRNHHKVIRREVERVDALCRALGGTFRMLFLRFLKDSDGDDNDDDSR